MPKVKRCDRCNRETELKKMEMRFPISGDTYLTFCTGCAAAFDRLDDELADKCYRERNAAIKKFIGIE